MTKDQLQKIEEAAEAWLKQHGLDYQKYGDRRKDRSAYDTMMKYEVSDLLLWTFEEGANWALQNLNHEETLRLIATGPRPDGTYNYDRRACQAIALAAIKNHESQTAIRREPTGEEHGDD